MDCWRSHYEPCSTSRKNIATSNTARSATASNPIRTARDHRIGSSRINTPAAANPNTTVSAEFQATEAHSPPPSGLLAVALRAVFDVAMFFRLVVHGEIASAFPVPLSLGVLIVVIADVCLLRRAIRPTHSRSWLTTLLVFGGVMLGQVVMIGLHVLTFGSTDYRRDADVAVVLGARVYPDGTLSLALSDRLDTAAELFREGRVRFVLVSGATGIEGINEADAMRRYLFDAGLPEDRILFDPAGVNTLATARNTRRLMNEHRLTSALIVSHYFHLARCKLLFEEQGVSAVTVPARMSRRLVLEAYYIFRECVGYLWYALTRPLRPAIPT